jgi:hypothetical protein
VLGVPDGLVAHPHHQHTKDAPTVLQGG